MTGFERNADVVQMCTYAPLFAHIDAWQWRPDLIWFDNLYALKTPNYYVQQLYATHAGTHVLTTSENSLPLEGKNGLYASSALDTVKNEIILKIANTSTETKKVTYTLNGLKASTRKGVHIVFCSENKDTENTLEKPNAVIPHEKEINLKGNSFEVELMPQSFNIFTIQK